MNQYHLAQINIAKARDDMDSEVMSGFVSRLDEINSLADQAPGFVWRLQGEEGDATSIQAFEDPRLLVNMSLWNDIESLKNYVYRSAHIDLIQNREAWFSKIRESHQVLWWVSCGHIPTPEEGKTKLQYLDEHGPSSKAFTFAKPFPFPPG